MIGVVGLLYTHVQYTNIWLLFRTIVQFNAQMITKHHTLKIPVAHCMDPHLDDKEDVRVGIGDGEDAATAHGGHGIFVTVIVKEVHHVSAVAVEVEGLQYLFTLAGVIQGQGSKDWLNLKIKPAQSKREREREREKERKRERQRDRDRDRERKRQRQTETERQRDRDRETETEKEREETEKRNNV